LSRSLLDVLWYPLSSSIIISNHKALSSFHQAGIFSPTTIQTHLQIEIPVIIKLQKVIIPLLTSLRSSFSWPLISNRLICVVHLPHMVPKASHTHGNTILHLQ
jgi:hypothetical protein